MALLENPSATPGPDAPLAPRTVRLLAICVDSVILVSAPLLALAGGLYGGLGAAAFLQNHVSGLVKLGAGLRGAAGMAILVTALVLWLGLVIYQWYLLAMRGQTIGKRLFGICIVDLRGGRAGFFRALLLRTLVFGSLLSAVNGALARVVPAVVFVTAALDVLPIFGPDRRCAHDYLAGTQVRWVSKGRGAATLLAAATVLVLAGAVAWVWREDLRMAWGAGAAAAPVITPPSAPLPATAPLVPAPPRPPAPEPTPEPASATPDKPAPRQASNWVYEDESGEQHFTNDPETIPARFRARAREILP